MDQTQIIAAVTSVTFIPTCIALVRKFFPAVDGKIVHLIALGLSAGSVALVAFASDIPRGVWIALGCIVLAVTTTGGTAYADRLVGKINGDKS